MYRFSASSFGVVNLTQQIDEPLCSDSRRGLRTQKSWWFTEQSRVIWQPPPRHGPRTR
jgi:hypothetical protein